MLGWENESDGFISTTGFDSSDYDGGSQHQLNSNAQGTAKFNRDISLDENKLYYDNKLFYPAKKEDLVYPEAPREVKCGPNYSTEIMKMFRKTA